MTPARAPDAPERTASGIPDHIVCLTDFEAAARKILPAMAYEYVASGAADEITVGWNVEAFRRLRLRPRVLADVRVTDTRIRLFGDELSCPILLAPTAYHRLMHPEGELATCRGAAAAGIPYIVSSATTTALPDIARAADGVRWFQLYLLGDQERTRDLVGEATAAGCRALVLTVDTPVAGARNREQRARVHLPDGISAPYFHHVMDTGRLRTQFQRPTWDDVDWLGSVTRLPLLLKGILTGRDAALAIEHGAAGIVVSNHGARNLDTVPASIDALPEVAAAVDGRVPILLDGGVRRGTDVIKALALGATAVMIGRPYLFALAVGGAQGVAAAVRILREELDAALALLGRPSIAAVDRFVLWEER